MRLEQRRVNETAEFILRQAFCWTRDERQSSWAGRTVQSSTADVVNMTNGTMYAIRMIYEQCSDTRPYTEGPISKLISSSHQIKVYVLCQGKYPDLAGYLEVKSPRA